MANLKTRIELNSSGIRQLLQSADMKSAIVREAGARGKIAKTFIGGDRVHVLIKEGDAQSDNRSKGD